MNKKILWILLLLTTLLSGCWDVTEPQRMYYIHGLGIDFKDGQYEIYVQIVDFTNIAKSDQPNPEAIQAEVGHAKGNTVEEALFDLYHSIDQRMFWGHISYLILSEEVMKSDKVNQVVDFVTRFRDTRYLIWVYSTKESLKDLLVATPITNKALTLSKLGDPLNSYAQESFVDPINIRKLVIGLNEPSHEISIPLVSINKDWSSSKGEKDAIEIKGVSVLSKNGLKGFLTEQNVHGIQWMKDDTLRSEVTVKVGSEDSDVTITLEKIKVIIDPVVKNDNVKFDITIQMNAIVNGLLGKITPDEVRQAVMKEIEKDVKETYKEALNMDIDIYRLSEQLYRKNMKVWKRLEKNGKIDLTKDSISDIKVEVHKVNPGRQTFVETIEN